MGTYVYRAYDDADRLLYVGISLNVSQRMQAHRASSEWYPLMARHEIDGPLSHQEALEAEVAAIRDEHPAYNVYRNNGSRLAWISEMEQEYAALTDEQRDALDVEAANCLNDAFLSLMAVKS